MDDPKRQLVVDKFKQSLEIGIQEGVEAKIDVNEFCTLLEAELFNGHTFREYKAKVFTLNFNMSDKRNPSIRQRILHGTFGVSQLAKASSEELACEDLQAQRQEWREKYYSTQVVKETQDEEVQPPAEVITETVKKVKLNFPINDDPLEALEIASEILPTIAMPPTPQKLDEPETSPPEVVPTEPAMNEYALKLKQKLELLTHPPLRNSHLMYFDYVTKHIYK